jgi:hypothetical protein
LLKHHWLEESQHTKLDTLIVEELAAKASEKEIEQAFEEYGKIGAFIDDGIKQQTEFEAGFGTKCEFIGPAEDVRKFVLSHSPLGVGIAILHIEWITLRHYIEGVRDNQDLDPQFKSLLKHHWLEESQHTKLDTLIVEELAAKASEKEIEQAFEEYGKIGAFIDDGIKQQTEFEVEAFITATGRELSSSEHEQMSQAVLKGMRWTYLGTGMTHPNFLDTVQSIKPEARAQIQQMAQAFC